MNMDDVDIDIEPDIILIDGQEPEISKKMIEKYPNAVSIIDAGRTKRAIRELCRMVNYGCAYRNEEGKIEIVPSLKVRAIDSTGAGDIFHGAFTYGIAQNWPMSKILRFSNLTGAMSVTRIGGRNSIFELDDMIEIYNEVK